METRGVSSHTVRSYRDTIKLFFKFASARNRRKAVQLDTGHLTIKEVQAFLRHAEEEHGNSIRTRNQRLAALKALCAYLATEDLFHATELQKIALLSAKREPVTPIVYLTEHEVQSVIKSIDRSTPLGHRNFALVHLFYNTGARVQELCDLRRCDVNLESPPFATITGKGQKTRTVPLWVNTVKILKAFFGEEKIAADSTEKIFRNRFGHSISRFGVRAVIMDLVEVASASCRSLKNKVVTPHTFRHTTAMHLLQSGVDVSVIKSWLGHVSLDTTHGYMEIDLEMKRRALAHVRPIRSKGELKPLLDKNRDLISWLESL